LRKQKLLANSLCTLKLLKLASIGYMLAGIKVPTYKSHKSRAAIASDCIQLAHDTYLKKALSLAEEGELREAGQVNCRK